MGDSESRGENGGLWRERGVSPEERMADCGGKEAGGRGG